MQFMAAMKSIHLPLLHAEPTLNLLYRNRLRSLLTREDRAVAGVDIDLRYLMLQIASGRTGSNRDQAMNKFEHIRAKFE